MQFILLVELRIDYDLASGAIIGIMKQRLVNSLPYRKMNEKKAVNVRIIHCTIYVQMLCSLTVNEILTH